MTESDLLLPLMKLYTDWLDFSEISGQLFSVFNQISCFGGYGSIYLIIVLMIIIFYFLID